MEKEREEDDFQAFRWKNVDGELVKDAEKLRPYDELDPLEDVTIEGLTFLGVDDKSGKWCLGGGKKGWRFSPVLTFLFFLSLSVASWDPRDIQVEAISLYAVKDKVMKTVRQTPNFDRPLRILQAEGELLRLDEKKKDRVVKKHPHQW